MESLQDDLPSIEVTGYNYAAASPNRMHDDAAARALGYEGALVPGVAVFSYLTRPVFAVHPDWLCDGYFSARFLRPVYDGRRYTASGSRSEDRSQYDLVLTSEDGTTCASGIAARRPEANLPSPIPESSVSRPRDERLQPKVEVLRPGTKLLPVKKGWTDSGWLGEFEGHFADQMGEGTSPDQWHRAYPLYLANALLMSNISLGLWIHTASEVFYKRIPSPGSPIEVQGWIVDSALKRGHVWCRVACIIRDGEGHLCAWLHHEALVHLARSA